MQALPAGALVCNKTQACSGCPVLDLPPEALLVQAVARNQGLDLTVVVDRDDATRAVLSRLRHAGHRPRVRVPGKQGNPALAATLVDLGNLTDRQAAALRAAHRLGYFKRGERGAVDALAKALGCSRSTAHEHLQKGLDRLLCEAFS